MNTKINQFILEFKWRFVPDVLKFPPNVPELSSSIELEQNEVTATLTTKIKPLRVQFCPRGNLFQIWRNSLEVFGKYSIYNNGMDRLSLVRRQKNKGNSAASLLITYGPTVRVMWSVNRINQGWKINQIKQLIALLMSLFVCRRHSHPAIQQAPIILIIFQITTSNLS